MWKVIAVDNYWTDEHKINRFEDEYSWIKDIASRVQSNFVTVDIARKECGELIILEFGDEQVPGLQQIRVGSFMGCCVVLSCGIKGILFNNMT